MIKNRCLQVLIILIFIICGTLGNNRQIFAGAKLADIANHWAVGQIQSMADEGIVSGYADNTFKPDAEVTRAEFVTMVNKVFKFTETIETSYPDVKAGDWFAGEIGKAKAAGYLGGYADGTMKPGNRISRQEAAVVIAQAAKLEPGSAQELAKFQDGAAIPAWSQGALAALVNRAYMGGYPDGTIKAGKSISRAEAAVLLANVKASVGGSKTQPEKSGADLSQLNQAGNYGPAAGQKDVNGNITITASGVLLQNVVLSGDLLITEAVGDGDVTLKNITVKGATTIKGGGANTVTIEDCVLGKTGINKSNGNIRVFLSGKTRIAELTADSAVKVEGQAVIDKAVINSAHVVIEAKPGSISIKGNLTATIAGKNETGTAAPATNGNVNSTNDSYSIPYVVDNYIVNTLLGNTYVTVNLKEDLAARVDKVLINGKAAVTNDGIIFRKALTGSFTKSAIVLAVTYISSTEPSATKFIIQAGCRMVYITDGDKTRVQVQTSDGVTGVTANDNDMQKIDGKWQCDLNGQVDSVTIIATDGTENETYMLTTEK